MMKFLPLDRTTSSQENPTETGISSALALTLLVLAAAAIRLYVLQNTTILNPDGPLYIHQAKAIASGEWKTALCTLPFLSNTSFFITLFHLFLGDWLLAARSVSLFFGTLAVVPLYGMFRQFFSKEESFGAAAILIFMPTWVYNSVDGVRDPVCWFFSLYGLYWLARGIREQRSLLFTLACIAFLMATWARVEAIWYIAATCLFLPLMIRQFCRVTTLIWFFLPLFLFGTIILVIDSLHGSSILAMSRLEDVRQAIINGLPQYSELRNALTIVQQRELENLLHCFLPEARNMVWLIALGTLVNRLCEALTYPFTLIALLGIKPFHRGNYNQKLVLLFTLLTSGALALLYTRTLQTWVMEYRYLMLAILPGLLYFCSGLSFLTEQLKKRFGLPRRMVLTMLVILFILITMPRYIKPRGGEETAIKEIGLYLAAHHVQGDEVRVITSSRTVRLIRFYANIDRPGIPCPERSDHLYTSLTGNTFAELNKSLEENQVDYLLWEENNAPTGWFVLLSEGEKEGRLQELGRWHNHQTGLMILYQIKRG
jgi:4-amino-4-deoxy-L-arabinose transferase-like glycosyltransferase